MKLNLQKIIDEGYKRVDGDRDFTCDASVDLYQHPKTGFYAMYDVREDKVLAIYTCKKEELNG